MRRIELGERPARGEDLAAWYAAALELQAESGPVCCGQRRCSGDSVSTC